jgi:hypothetical protein
MPFLFTTASSVPTLGLIIRSLNPGFCLPYSFSPPPQFQLFVILEVKNPNFYLPYFSPPPQLQL